MQYHVYSKGISGALQATHGLVQATIGLVQATHQLVHITLGLAQTTLGLVQATFGLACAAIPLHNRSRVDSRHMFLQQTNVERHLPLIQYYTNITSVFKFKVVYEETVRIIIKHLPTTNSSGIYGISSKLLTIIEPAIFTPLTLIINQGIFPGNLIIAKFVPIFKVDDSISLNNYRLISLLPTCFMGWKSGTGDKRRTNNVGKKEAREPEFEMRGERQERLGEVNQGRKTTAKYEMNWRLLIEK